MTHDELTGMLRNLPTPSIGGAHPGGVQMLAADRLDLYRDIIRRCEWRLPCSTMREDIVVLQRDIQEAISDA